MRDVCCFFNDLGHVIILFGKPNWQHPQLHLVGDAVSGNFVGGFRDSWGTLVSQHLRLYKLMENMTVANVLQNVNYLSLLLLLEPKKLSNYVIQQLLSKCFKKRLWYCIDYTISWYYKVYRSSLSHCLHVHGCRRTCQIS